MTDVTRYLGFTDESASAADLEQRFDEKQDALYPITLGDAGAVDPRYPIGNILRYGATGEPTYDATNAFRQAIAAAYTFGADVVLPFGLPEVGAGVHYINDRVTIATTPGIAILGRGGRLVYNGPHTDRMIDLLAADVTFDRVLFDGNGKQVLGCLGYIHTNAARPHFIRCRTFNIAGTHEGGSVQMGNTQYGWVISPYGVLDYVFDHCRFDHITNDNTGLNQTDDDPAEGGGFCGAMWVGMRFKDLGLPGESLDNVTDPQTQAPSLGITSGHMIAPVIEDIETILPVGLSVADQIRFDDADGIRMYGDDVNSPPTGAKELHLRITDPIFRRVTKRAIKGSVSGHFTATNVLVDARGMTFSDDSPRSMVTAVKLEQGCKVTVIDVQSDAVAPVRMAFQSHDGDGWLVSNFHVAHCLGFYNFSPVDSTLTLGDMGFDTGIVDHCYEYGVLPSGSVARINNFIFRHITITAAAGVHNVNGFVAPIASSGFSGANIRDVQFVNCDFRSASYDTDIDCLEVLIDDAAFAGTTDVPLVSIGAAPNATRRRTHVKGLRVTIDAIPNDFITAARGALVSLIGPDAEYRALFLRVPQTLEVTRPHLDIYGSRVTLDGLTYDGPGRVHASSTLKESFGPYKNVALYNLVRTGDTVTALAEFLYLDGGQNGVIDGVTDFRDWHSGFAGTIRINGGTPDGAYTKAYAVSNVISRTTSATIVADGNIALLSNIQKFS